MISGASELELSYMEQIMDLQKELEYQKEMEEEFNKKHTKLMQKYSKQKEVLDKIKKYILEHCEIILHEEENTTEVGNVDGKKILELLEEIE